MSMFGKLKQIKDLKAKAKEFEAMLGDEEVTASKRGISITMSGTQKIQSVELSEDFLKPENKKDLEKSIKEAFEDATSQIQKIMAKKLMANKDFKFPGME